MQLMKWLNLARNSACKEIAIPFFYASIYGQRIVRLSNDVSFYLLPILNAGSIFGRIIPGLLADRFGSLNVMVPCGLVTAILAFA